MRTALCLFAALVAAALPAASQTPSPAQPQTQTEPQDRPANPGTPLNLRLEEATPSRPRITFDKPDPASDKDAEKGLPSLGGKPSGSWGTPGSAVYPKDMNPGR